METFKERTEREIKEKFMEMDGKSGIDEEIDPLTKQVAAYEKLRADYHRKCDEVVVLQEEVKNLKEWNYNSHRREDERTTYIMRLKEEITASRTNEQKARDERDAALVKLSKVRSLAETWGGPEGHDIFQIIGKDPLLPKARSEVSLHDKQDGIWLGVHASSTGRSALVLLEQHGWGRLVRQTFADYFAERSPEGPAANRST